MTIKAPGCMKCRLVRAYYSLYKLYMTAIFGHIFRLIPNTFMRTFNAASSIR